MKKEIKSWMEIKLSYKVNPNYLGEFLKWKNRCPKKYLVQKDVIKDE